MYRLYSINLSISLLYSRSISGVRGFSRETLVAVVANIESREWRKKFNSEHNVPAEHPRASTTDDVECFFSLLRDCVGKDFTLKEVFNIPVTYIYIYMITFRYIMVGER